MPFAINNGVYIYCEVVGNGPPLVLHHGLGLSLEEWKDLGYVSALESTFQLILLDARGHGNSDKPHNSDAYTLHKRVTDVLAVLDKFDIARAHFWGYSMGGWIGFGLAHYALERLQSLTITGAHPYAENMAPYRQLLTMGLPQFVEFAEILWAGRMSVTGKNRMLANDGSALLASLDDRRDLSDILPSIGIPTLLVSGDRDSRHRLIHRCAQAIPTASFISVPECDHALSFADFNKLFPLILRFLLSQLNSGAKQS